MDRDPRLVFSILLGISVVFMVKVMVGVLYSCRPVEFSNPVNFSFVVYEETVGEPVAVEELSYEGILVVDRVGDGRVFFNLTSRDGSVVLSSVYDDGRYYFVARDGRLVESGVSPFFLHKPCFDTVIPNLLDLRYFGVQLEYEVVSFSRFLGWNGTLLALDYGYAVSVYSGEKIVYGGDEAGVLVVFDYFSVNYVGGYGVGGTFLLPRDVVLVDGLNYSVYVAGYSPVVYGDDGEPTFLAGVRGFDLPSVVLLPIGVGVGLVFEGVRRRVGGRWRPG